MAVRAARRAALGNLLLEPHAQGRDALVAVELVVGRETIFAPDVEIAAYRDLHAGAEAGAAPRPVQGGIHMADRQTTQLLDSMRPGMPFVFTTKMSMTKRLATLVSVAELFGYRYAGARQEIFSIKLAFAPDPSPRPSSERSL